MDCECPACGGEGQELGVLGHRQHMRCRACGANFSYKLAQMPKPGAKVCMYCMGPMRKGGHDWTDVDCFGEQVTTYAHAKCHKEQCES